MAEPQPSPAEFAGTMRSFIEWYFRTLDPAFAAKLLGGRTIEQGAADLFASIIEPVRGNRGDDSPMTAADYGAIMDALAILHLRTRHGENAVRRE